jgi:hypothetical protein
MPPSSPLSTGKSETPITGLVPHVSKEKDTPLSEIRNPKFEARNKAPKRNVECQSSNVKSDPVSKIELGGSGSLLEVGMKLPVTGSVAILLLLSLPFAAPAGDFEGIKPLLCSVNTVIECTPEDGCREVAPESVSLPSFLKVDFDKKRVKAARESDGNRNSDIKRMERLGGKLILQGSDEGIQEVRDGVGWTASVSEQTGKFVLTASGDEEAFIVYGACIPLP